MKVGIIGGGQLAQMLALAGYPLGIHCVCLTEQTHSPASCVAPIIAGSSDDLSALQQLAAQTHVLTYENENINVSPLVELATPLRPQTNALRIAQDRWLEKCYFTQHHIPTTQYVAIASHAELRAAVDTIGYPAILKTRHFGYDGKGQHTLRSPADIATAWHALGQQPLLLENHLAFEFEVSQIAVRDAQGHSVFYPLCKNHHRAGILRYTTAPFVADPDLSTQAQHYTQTLLDALDYVGTLTVEFFVVQGQLIANEIAPRVHNSGHWTLAGAATCQFENHLRAICQLPLGSTQPKGYSAMVNCIGNEPALAAVLAIPNVSYHHYGKAPRPQRKLAHININCADADTRDQRLQQVLHLLETGY